MDIHNVKIVHVLVSGWHLLPENLSWCSSGFAVSGASGWGWERP